MRLMVVILVPQVCPAGRSFACNRYARSSARIVARTEIFGCEQLGNLRRAVPHMASHESRRTVGVAGERGFDDRAVNRLGSRMAARGENGQAAGAIEIVRQRLIEFEQAWQATGGDQRYMVGAMQSLPQRIDEQVIAPLAALKPMMGRKN